MTCLVFNVVLAFALMVYLPGGNALQREGEYKRQGSFKGSLLTATATRSQLACLSTCLKHHSRCWGAMYNEGIGQCQLLQYALNQPTTTFLSSETSKLFGRVIYAWRYTTT